MNELLQLQIAARSVKCPYVMPSACRTETIIYEFIMLVEQKPLFTNSFSDNE